MRKDSVTDPLQQSYKTLHAKIKASSQARKKRISKMVEFASILFKGGFDEGKNGLNMHKYLIMFGHSQLDCAECWSGDEGSYVCLEDITYATKRARIDTFEMGEMSFAEKVRDWVRNNSGTFCVQDANIAFNCVQRHEKERMRVTLFRIWRQGLIERDGKRAGSYRIVQEDAPSIDILNLDTSTFPIYLPLDLHELVTIQPKNIIIIAGEPDAGKSCFCLNTAQKNIGRGYDIRYLTSEMGGTELAYRLKMFEPDMPYSDWTAIDWKERSSDFQDVILPDGLTIIDYLKLTDNFYMIGGEIRKIFEKMDKGVAVISIQKGRGKELGIGGHFTIEESRLYVTLSRGGTAKIMKAKNWKKPDVNPNYRECDYHIIGGCKMMMATTWMKPKEKDDDA
jgi:hypothetical protein